MYRGGSAVVGGGIMAALSIAGAVDLVVEEGSADLIGSAVLLLVAAFAVVLGPYPAASSGEDGLRIRNPFRAIDLPWSTVTDVKAGLSFIAFTAQRKYTVWAIPVSLRDRRRAEKQRYRDLARQQRGASRGLSGRGGAFGSMMSGGGGGSTDPSERLSFADQAVMEINARREAYAVRLKREEVARAHGFTSSGARINTTTDDTVADKASDAAATPAEAPETVAAGPAVSVKWSAFPPAIIGIAALLLIIAIIVK